MTQNDRQQANELMAELRAQRTAYVRELTDQIVNDPEFVEFLATLYVLWYKEFGDFKAKHADYRIEGQALLALDEALRCFAHRRFQLKNDSGYIKNAEAFNKCPKGWTYTTTASWWKNNTILPRTTWRYVFFKDGSPMAGFDDQASALNFMEYLDSKGCDPQAESYRFDLTPKQQRELSPEQFFILKDGWRPSIAKVNGDGKTAIKVERIMPTLCHPTIQDDVAERIVKLLNTCAAESRAIYDKKKTNN